MVIEYFGNVSITQTRVMAGVWAQRNNHKLGSPYIPALVSVLVITRAVTPSDGDALGHC